MKNPDITEKAFGNRVNKIITGDFRTDEENDEAAHITEYPSARIFIFRT